MDKSFEDKVKNKLELNKVNDVVKQLETPPTKDLKIDIPSNPFESGDGESEYESSELDFKQNVLFNKFLKKNGFDDFGDWWKREGKDRILEMIDDGRRNNNHIDYKDELGWWNRYFKENTDKILYGIIWGDTK
jgi:hypothetical protein